MFLGFGERLALRRSIVQGINSGQLPSSASIVLSNPEAFYNLERTVADRAQASSHPILAWIAANLPTIIQDVLALLPLFGVNVPHITIPPLPTPTTPAPGHASDPTMPAGMALPVWAAPLVEQLVAQALQKLLPILEAKIEDWVNSHAKAA